MKQGGLLIALVLTLFLAHSAFADCYSFTLVYWQYTQWWDGSITWSIQHVDSYSICEVTGGSSGGGTGGGGAPQPIPPSVSVSGVNTTDINSPTISADITQRDPSNPLTVIQLDVDGTTVDFVSFQGNARYTFFFAPIAFFGEGTHT